MAINELTVKSLLQFDGSQGGTAFNDNAGIVTWTRTGTPTTTTTQAKFGQSGVFSGASQYIAAPYNEAMDLVGSSFVIEGWIWPNAVKASGHRIFGSGGGSAAWNATNGMHVMAQLVGTAQYPSLSVSSGTATPRTVTHTVPVNQNAWNHVVFQYDAPSQTLTVGINGSLVHLTVAAPARPSTNPTSTYATLPGENGSSTYAWNGYLDSFRISRDTTGGYTGSTYTVPTEPYDIPTAGRADLRKTRLILTPPSNNAGWVNPANGIVSDNVYTTNGSPTGSGSNARYTLDTNVMAVVPPEAIIQGLEINVEAKASIVGTQLPVIAGAGATFSSSDERALTTADTWYKFGGPSEKINATTRDSMASVQVTFTKKGSGQSTTYSVDAVTVDVYWNLPPLSSGNVALLGCNF